MTIEEHPKIHSKGDILGQPRSRAGGGHTVPTNRSREGAGTRSPSGEGSVSSATVASAALRMAVTTSDGYELPVIHLRLPERAVNMAFWGALLGSAAFGAVDAPLAALIGLGVVIARHRKAS
ncbi:MAG: hypothetical protein ACYDGY_08960 [Acidimicrobiales bacterium]